MKILVTGANGFVGSALCKKLTEEGYDVKGLVRKTSDLSSIQDLPIKIVYGSLEDKESLNKAVEEVDIVFHLACTTKDWAPKEFYHQVIVKGTRNMVEASINARVSHFIYISSAAVLSYITNTNPNHKFPKFHSTLYYGVMKKDAEDIVMDYHKKGKINATIIRPGHVIGPGNRDYFKMMKKLKTGKFVTIGNSKYLAPFVYVDNLVDVLILAATNNNASGQIYEISDGVKITLREYREKICKELGITLSVYPISSKISYPIAWILENVYIKLNIKSRPFIILFDVISVKSDFYIDIAKAKNELGYHPKVGVDEGIKKTLEWYKKKIMGKNQ